MITELFSLKRYAEIIPAEKRIFPLELIPEEVITNFFLFDLQNYISSSHKFLSFISLGFKGNYEFKLGGFAGIQKIELSNSENFFKLINVEVRIEDTFSSFILRDFELNIVFDPTYLKPVNIEGHPQAEFTMIKAVVTVEIDTNLNLNILPIENAKFSLTPCLVANTGIIITVDNVIFSLPQDNLQISFERAQLSLPEIFIIPEVKKIFIENAIITNKGFSGSCSVDLNLRYNGDKNFIYEGSTDLVTIFGIPGGLKNIELRIEDNQLIAFNLEGQLLIPYFDKPVDVKFNIENDGCISVSLLSLGSDPIPITKDELITLYIQSIAFDCHTSSFSISGGIEPLLFSKDGIKWPLMDVENLRIARDGTISIDEAWLTLKEMVNLDLWGFNFELRKIGIGTTQDNKMWVAISGAVKLIEQLPLGLDVEGFKIAWPRDLNFTDPSKLQENLSKIEIQFAGVEINFGVPQVVKIDGLIRFFKEAQKVGFAGDMKLAVIPAGFTAEAGLMVGMNMQNPAFPFMYVYFGFESAAGIPLGSTGLSLKGAIGLIGMNVAPNKTSEQNWYHDWYKGPPAPGVQQTTKWTDKRDAFAIGIGVTISTSDGVVKTTKGLLVLAIPGPILIIEGKAFLLNPDTSAEEGTFGALAVFDGNEGTVQFNIEAQAELVKDMIDAHASVEAFFDLDDITNWHLYLGQDEPQDRRIRANVMNILTADAYLMLDMIDADSPRMRTGVSVKIEPEIPPFEVELPGNFKVGIEIEAYLKIEGSGVTSINPEQFSGNVDIDGELTINACGIEFGISGFVHTNFEGPKPFKLDGELGYTLNLPWPCPDFEGSAEFKFEIPEVHLEINNPVQSVALFSRFTNESKSLELYNAKPSDETITVENSTLVPIDVNPVIAFGHEMNSVPTFLMHPANLPKRYEVGKITFTPTLNKIIIREKKKNEPWSDSDTWPIIYATDTADHPSELLQGVWLAESDTQSPSEPASRRLQLLTDNPLINTAHSYVTEGAVLSTSTERVQHIEGVDVPESNVPTEHLSQSILNDYPGLMFHAKEAKENCVDFVLEEKRNIAMPAPADIYFASLDFISDERIDIGFSKNPCNGFGLTARKKLIIKFPLSIAQCQIVHCKLFRKGDKYEIEPKILYYRNDRSEPIAYANAPSAGASTGVWEKFPFGPEARSDYFFDRIEIIADIIALKEICYIAKDDLESAKAAEEQVNANNANAVNGNGDNIKSYLNPGCYYRIEIFSSISGTAPDGPYKTALKNNSALGNSENRSYTKIVYFQTEAPPNNLAPYIKWTYPNQELNRVYCADDFAICFKRDYLKILFNGQGEQLKNFKMNAYVVDQQTNYFQYNTVWVTSNAHTLFPDEFTWQEYRGSLTQRKDDILLIQKSSPSFSLLPNKKYDLILTGGDGGEVFIPKDLKQDMVARYWDESNEFWNYNSNDKIYSLKNNGAKQLLSRKEDFGNIEIVADIKGLLPFGFVIKNKKNENKESYYAIKFQLTLGKLTFEAHDGINKNSKEFDIDINEYASTEWKKFKIRVIRNRIKVFCFYKELLHDEFDLASLNFYSQTSSGGPIPIERIVVLKINSTGKVGLYALNTNTQFRNVEIKNTELLSIPFYTTGFTSIKKMFEPSLTNQIKELKIVNIPATFGTSDLDVFKNSLHDNIASKSLDFYKVQKDYEYGMAKYPQDNPSLYGREAVEKYRLELRDAYAQLDDLFISLGVKLVPDVLFSKPQAGVDFYAVIKENQGQKQIVAFYIKSREKLFPSPIFFNYYSGTDNSDHSNYFDPFARMTIDISFQGQTEKIFTTKTPQQTSLIFNSDGDQLIMNVNSFNIALATEEVNKKELRFDFSFIKKFPDDSTNKFLRSSDENKHHRYDRPTIYNSDEYSFSVTFRI